MAKLSTFAIEKKIERAEKLHAPVPPVVVSIWKTDASGAYMDFIGGNDPSLAPDPCVHLQIVSIPSGRFVAEDQPYVPSPPPHVIAARGPLGEYWPEPVALIDETPVVLPVRQSTLTDVVVESDEPAPAKSAQGELSPDDAALRAKIADNLRKVFGDIVLP